MAVQSYNNSLPPEEKIGSIENRNFLSPVGFKFNLVRAPKVDFFSNQANIPGINLGVAVQSTYLKDISIPGDKLVYNDFSIQFMIDENLENYLEIHDWMRGLGYPQSVAEAEALYTQAPYIQNSTVSAYSDGSLLIYNSNFNEVAKVNFLDMFPVSLTPIQFNAQNSDINYIMAEATFKYTIFNVESLIKYES